MSNGHLWENKEKGKVTVGKIRENFEDLKKWEI
jgi:hypothetical protein